jgi:hypothetical protein
LEELNTINAIFASSINHAEELSRAKEKAIN